MGSVAMMASVGLSEALKNKRLQAELLCFGFLRDALSHKLIIPHYIISCLCIRFFMLRIDYFKPHSKCHINEKGNTFSGTNISSHSDCLPYAISQCGWSRGCHEMSIKVVKHDYHQFVVSIGIVTNPDIDVKQWMFDSPESGCSYQCYFGCYKDLSKPGIYEMRNGKSNCLMPIQEDIHGSNDKDAMNGAVITMEVDCDENTIRFKYNKEQIGETVQIPSKKKYHAAIVYNT